MTTQRVGITLRTPLAFERRKGKSVLHDLWEWTLSCVPCTWKTENIFGEWTPNPCPGKQKTSLENEPLASASYNITETRWICSFSLRAEWCALASLRNLATLLLQDNTASWKPSYVPNGIQISSLPPPLPPRLKPSQERIMHTIAKTLQGLHDCEDFLCAIERHRHHYKDPPPQPPTWVCERMHRTWRQNG